MLECSNTVNKYLPSPTPPLVEHGKAFAISKSCWSHIKIHMAWSSYLQTIRNIFDFTKIVLPTRTIFKFVQQMNCSFSSPPSIAHCQNLLWQLTRLIISIITSRCQPASSHLHSLSLSLYPTLSHLPLVSRVRTIKANKKCKLHSTHWSGNGDEIENRNGCD